MDVHYRTPNTPRVMETAGPESGMPYVDGQESRGVQFFLRTGLTRHCWWKRSKIYQVKDASGISGA